jgi:hypothetical protein
VQPVLLKENGPVVKDPPTLGLVMRGGITRVVVDGGGATTQANTPTGLLHPQVKVFMLAKPADRKNKCKR